MPTDNTVNAQIEKITSVSIDESKINEDVKKIIDKANSLSNEVKVKLLRDAVGHIDLTSLKGGETFEDIKKLCEKAYKDHQPFRTAAVCVFPASACDAIKALKDLDARDIIKVASVAGDFPASKLPLETRINEIKQVVNYGVDEVDLVISRQLALEHKWQELYDELKLEREACGKTKMKTILATGDLATLNNIYTASLVAMLAGSDFIKTSTGKEEVNATLPVGVVMCKAIKDYQNITGKKIGLKPAGGIKTSEDTIQWMTLIKEELGDEWLTPKLFRIGASSVLDDIVEKINIYSK